MNDAQDWDVIWRWQWFRRALWMPHFRDAAHPEGRPARSCILWQWILNQYGATRVLDANAGLGQRAVLLAECGLDMVGSDSSPMGISCARELAGYCEARVEFVQSHWADLGQKYPEEFDAIIHDAINWCQNEKEMQVAIAGLAGALKPGGVIIFTGADEWSHPEEREKNLERLWSATPRYQIRGEYQRDGLDLKMLVARDLVDFGVVENYLFLIKQGEELRLETAAICNSLKWTWNDFKKVFHTAGFSNIESVKIPAGKREHILNIARK